jgi:hypothetical protein
VRLDATAPGEAALTSAVLAATLSSRPWLEGPGLLRRGAGLVGELLALVGIVLCFPLAILAVGIPIALCVRLLLWILGLL